MFQFEKALWVCQTMFAGTKHKNTAKSIHIFTNNADPTDGDAQMAKASLQKSRDLVSTGVELYLYKMKPRHGGSFRTDNFFGEVLSPHGGGEARRPLRHLWRPF